ncbi:MAG: 16S rRNA (guanine(966)-N(2))-methyltransferase RsmD [Eubacterium sp.]|nr:16S rRNA (guanine(966)-N(2))-methyltransferase RsmD [Eubacterium sp.]
MRVITGKYKGRKLETPSGKEIRPTSDKVKESIFNLLMNDCYDAVFCDLFCGTGSLGIEALSRGARKCYFCDSARESIRLTRDNLAHCGAEDEAVVLQGEYGRALGRIREKVDVFLLDPPYRAGLYESCLAKICELDLLQPDGIIIAEHDSRGELPSEVNDLVLTRERRYGKTTISIYRHRDFVSRTENEEEE